MGSNKFYKKKKERRVVFPVLDHTYKSLLTLTRKYGYVRDAQQKQKQTSTK